MMETLWSQSRARVTVLLLVSVLAVSLVITFLSESSLLAVTDAATSFVVGGEKNNEASSNVVSPAPSSAPTATQTAFPTAFPSVSKTFSPTLMESIWMKPSNTYNETLFLVNETSTTFTGITTLEERNELYTDPKYVRCGMLGPEQPGLMPQLNKTGVVLFTAVANCYDLPPPLANAHLANHRVALVDKRSAKFIQRIGQSADWELLLLEPWPGDFLNTPALLAEVAKSLSPRIFPNADWIIFADGKARFNVADVLDFAKKSGKSLLAARHLVQRPTKDEFGATRDAMKEPWRNTSALQLKKMDEHEQLYEVEGFFKQSSMLPVPDIMILMTKPRDPALLRVMCGWFNEITFLSMRGQLSFYYPLVRLKQLHLYSPLPEGWVKAANHLAEGCK